jgi:hypothetical protein
MSVFYAYSNNRDETKITYDKICEEFKDIIIDVDNNDLNNSHQLLTKIKNHIKKADIFVCDITPDAFVPNTETPLPNPNVMLELGYALEHFESNNIILLLNENISKDVPSMLSGFEITYYNSKDDEYYLNIVEKIKSSIKNLYDKGWTNFKYQLTDKFITSLEGILDILPTNYTIRINQEINQAVILFTANNGLPRKINIITKKLTLKNKEICLSNYDNLCKELQHLELIINLRK